MKYLLALIYASRAAIVAIYIVMPKTALNVYLFAGALGFTWLATVPPTSGLVGKLFGTRYLATLFGLTLLSHQIGGFLGAWLGGVALAQTGSYEWIWYADIALALLAAAVNLPIREAQAGRAARYRLIAAAGRSTGCVSAVRRHSLTARTVRVVHSPPLEHFHPDDRLEEDS